MVEDTRFPPDVQVKKGYSWSEQLGIAIAALVEDGHVELIDWTKEVYVLPFDHNSLELKTILSDPGNGDWPEAAYHRGNGRGRCPSFGRGT